MDEFRSFIALEIPKAIQNDFSHLIDMLKKILPLPIRWVQPGNIHMTLKFMGNISNTMYAALKVELVNIFGDLEPVALKFTGLGVFPNIRDPKVFWVGMETSEYLITRVNLVEQFTRSLGIVPENRPFSAHLTLGRINENSGFAENPNIGKILSSVKYDLPDTLFSKYITIFKSDLTRQGPIYSPLFRVELQKHG
jgi:2'-5' RNA ligase